MYCYQHAAGHIFQMETALTESVTFPLLSTIHTEQEPAKGCFPTIPFFKHAQDAASGLSTEPSGSATVQFLRSFLEDRTKP